MTFYWWSHWFWITLLSNILLLISSAHTYPSQEISLEYNQNAGTVKAVTKLHQTATTSPWATTIATPSQQKIVSQKTNDDSNSNTDPEVDSSSNLNPNDRSDLIVPTKVGDENPRNYSDSADDPADVSATDYSGSIEESEYKRSIEGYSSNQTRSDRNKSNTPEQSQRSNDKDKLGSKRDNANPLGYDKLKRDESEITNYTNFSSTVGNGTEEGRTNSNSSTTTNIPLANPQSINGSMPPPKQKLDQTPASSSSSAASVSSAVSAAPPLAPKIDSSTLEWLNAMAAQMPATVTGASVKSDSNSENESESVTLTTATHKIPFTLENANKEEELRRAENEHRSRKSKVLSAEYKHINRFINYSTDSKSLLARSASTAPNEFEASDEGNISSEALSIQRTYFLDAGAISAICFTIFGVCCTVGTIGIVLYRRRYLNKPQALSEPDSSVYIDDSTMRVSDNSDEMYSLDNDSFLNSLEAMTIQNYWTDTVKHTKL